MDNLDLYIHSIASVINTTCYKLGDHMIFVKQTNENVILKSE